MTKCKFYKQLQYYSDDNGTTWFPTGLSRKGELIESGSTDCDEPTPPTPIDGKYLFTYSDSSTRSGACNSSSAITSNDTCGQDKPYSAMTEAVIGNCVTSIDDETFYEFESLTSVTIPNSVTSIGDSAFQNCRKLKSVTIPSGVTWIRDRTFYRCEMLESVTIPNTVTNIVGGAFALCHTLSSITIPSSVTYIGQDAFHNCTSLQSITVEATTPPSMPNVAFSSTGNCPIYVPSESVNAYKTASGWSTYASRIQAIQ